MTTVSKLKILKRAALVAALFFAPQASLATTETYRDLIEKAYNLSLQKDRTQAVSILVGALKRESRKSVAQKELASALEQVSKVFYSDKAQQLYELALSLKFTDSPTALSKLQEAARLEPENISIEIALARQLLSNNDCDGASALITKYKDLAPAIEEIRLVQGQAKVCLGQFPAYLAIKNNLDLKQSSFALFWQTLESEYFFKTGAFPKALESALAAQKLDPNLPEAHYWQWKAEKQKSPKAAQKYLSLCKTLNSRQQRQYLPEPQLCRRTAEIETFLKKNNNSEV